MTFPKIKKAIFLVAGFGTRLLPISKAVPKQMLPIIDKPLLQYLVEEVVEAGIEDIIFITGRGKHAIEEHFDTSYELEEQLKVKNKVEMLDNVQKISKMARFAYVRQAMPNGDADAIKHARPYIENEPVLMVFPDYIMPRENNTFNKMVNFYKQTGKPILAMDMVPEDKVSSFGVIGYEDTEKNDIVKVTKFVEKPKQDQAPSNYINLGWAILTPDIWNSIDECQSTVVDGELRVADAFIHYMKKNDLFALKPVKNGYDCGNSEGLLKANIAFGLENPKTKDELLKFIQNKLNEIEIKEQFNSILHSNQMN
jgi:UTP--glucose-1-phosphate uridylyltransferase